MCVRFVRARADLRVFLFVPLIDYTMRLLFLFFASWSSFSWGKVVCARPDRPSPPQASWIFRCSSCLSGGFHVICTIVSASLSSGPRAAAAALPPPPPTDGPAVSAACFLVLFCGCGQLWGTERGPALVYPSPLHFPGCLVFTIYGFFFSLLFFLPEPSGFCSFFFT